MHIYEDIRESRTWEKIELVNKGWSKDKKYHIYTKKGEELLLRVSDIFQYEIKKKEFENMTILSKSNILMSFPLDFGVCNNNKSVYSLHTWIKGEEAELALRKVLEQEQYELGYKAGQYLKQIHKLPAPKSQTDWAEKFNRKIDRNLKNYQQCGIKFSEADFFINYVNHNRELLRNRPQCFQHGDYHIGNMIITPTGELGIIDFNRWDYGDPWEEFNRIVWCVRTSKSFASGYINGYFNNDIPELFFRLMALYIASNQLASIPWAIQFGQEEIDVMTSLAQDLIGWYDDFIEFIPKWYKTIEIRV